MGLGLMICTGCATSTRIAIDESQRTRIGAARTVIDLPQKEIAVSIVPATAGATLGLIGALLDMAVDNSRVKTAEAAVAPVRDALVDYAPASTLQAELTRALSSVEWLKGNSVEVRRVASESNAVAELVRQIGTDAVLLVQTDYRLSPKFDAIVLTARVSLLPRSAAVASSGHEHDGAPKPLYFNTVYTTAQLSGVVVDGTKLDDAARLWAANRGQSARRALDGGMRDLARLIAFDLAQASPADKSASYQGPVGAPTLNVIGKYGRGLAKGYVERAGSGRSWVRLPTGELCSAGELYQ